jgi:uncharacterized membrane protein
MCRARDLFSKEEMEDIQQAITWAELDTSGEIRVHIEDTCVGDPMERAREIFFKLGMESTELRNGLLFYLATESRKFAILTDEGIRAQITNGFWDVINQKMLNLFREGRFTEGLCEGITFAGEQLRKLFPRRKKDKNELPDEVTFGVI